MPGSAAHVVIHSSGNGIPPVFQMIGPTSRPIFAPLSVFAARKRTGGKMSGFFPNSYDLAGKKMPGSALSGGPVHFPAPGS
jgi:hypothetical protein